MTRRQIMAQRRACTYSITFVLVILMIILLNNLLLVANLKSVNDAPKMVWHGGVYTDQTAVDELLSQEDVLEYVEP